MRNNKGFASIFFLLGILIIAGVIAFSFYSKQKSLDVGQSNPTTLPISEITEAPTPTNSPYSKTFISEDLGISFNYLVPSLAEPGPGFEVKQVGNKVFYYSLALKPEDGQSVEVFTKDKNESLVEAIKKRFLANYSANDCIVKKTKNPVANQHYPGTYELAEITISTPWNDGIETIVEKESKCPKGYTASNGISYFLTDTNHPDKFVYFSIGQYGMESGISDKLWQTTLKFLP